MLGTLYTGPLALLVYWISRRDYVSEMNIPFVQPLWKQAARATVHCVTGCGTGVLVAAVIVSFFRVPLGLETLVEYAAAFLIGLLFFQALFTKHMVGCTYRNAVKTSWLAQLCSMNTIMAGMIPVVIILMTYDMRAMEVTSIRFWGVMSLALLVGAVFSFPMNGG